MISIEKIIQDSIDVKQLILNDKELIKRINEAAMICVESLKNGGKIHFLKPALAIRKPRSSSSKYAGEKTSSNTLRSGATAFMASLDTSTANPVSLNLKA